MISVWSTIIGFISLVFVKLLDFITPPDCLGLTTSPR